MRTPEAMCAAIVNPLSGDRAATIGVEGVAGEATAGAIGVANADVSRPTSIVRRG